jgi:hypothetical protein
VAALPFQVDKAGMNYLSRRRHAENASPQLRLLRQLML